MKLSEGLQWAAIGSGVLATLGGLKTYGNFVGTVCRIPMQFGINGATTWFLNSPHGFLIYPLTTAMMTGGCYLMSKSEPSSDKISYPFEFDEEQREKQHELAVTYTNSIGLLTNSFLCLLSVRYIPEIVGGRRMALPAGFVGAFLASLFISSGLYVFSAYKHKEKREYARLQ
mmetsp:Transcript_31057/g.48417  ORF Transcript_31057/g.48417 Transcript_31057/m.48417 type:complete len:172 (-) Transcript_31057:91-606(-)